MGLAAATRDVLGFGLALVDFDGDGRIDLMQANGHVLDRERLGDAFRDAADSAAQRRWGISRCCSMAPGPGSTRPMLGRGLAVGDLDGDSRPDVVVNSVDASAAVLRNVSEGNHFLGLDIVDKAGGSAVGARVDVRVGGRRHASVVTAGGSYLASSPARLFLGLGGMTAVERIDVAWPWGLTEILDWSSGGFPWGIADRAGERAPQELTDPGISGF